MIKPRVVGLLLSLTVGVVIIPGRAQPATAQAEQGLPVATSDFNDGAEGWRTVFANGQPNPPVPRYHAEGGNPGGHLSATDNERGPQWYWLAPAKFLGDVSRAYRYELNFDLKQSDPSQQTDAPDIILVGGGLKLTLNTGYNPGAT